MYKTSNSIQRPDLVLSPHYSEFIVHILLKETTHELYIIEVDRFSECNIHE